MATAIKFILIILFLICLFDMPYGYYQLVRFAGFLGFGLLAYISNKRKQETEVIIYIALALLFQPFIKVALGRIIWNIVDVLVAAGLIISLLQDRAKINKKAK
jgi:hypothetical protein